MIENKPSALAGLLPFKLNAFLTLEEFAKYVVHCELREKYSVKEVFKLIQASILHLTFVDDRGFFFDPVDQIHIASDFLDDKEYSISKQAAISWSVDQKKGFRKEEYLYNYKITTDDLRIHKFEVGKVKRPPHWFKNMGLTRVEPQFLEVKTLYSLSDAMSKCNLDFDAFIAEKLIQAIDEGLDLYAYVNTFTSDTKTISFNDIRTYEYQLHGFYKVGFISDDNWSLTEKKEHLKTLHELSEYDFSIIDKSGNSHKFKRDLHIKLEQNLYLKKSEKDRVLGQAKKAEATDSSIEKITQVVADSLGEYSKPIHPPTDLCGVFEPIALQVAGLSILKLNCLSPTTQSSISAIVKTSSQQLNTLSKEEKTEFAFMIANMVYAKLSPKDTQIESIESVNIARLYTENKNNIGELALVIRSLNNGRCQDIFKDLLKPFVTKKEKFPLDFDDLIVFARQEKVEGFQGIKINGSGNNKKLKTDNDATGWSMQSLNKIFQDMQTNIENRNISE